MSQIEIADGMMSVQIPGRDAVVLTELPMASYELFYRHWILAVQSLAKEEDENHRQFTLAYCTNEVFRSSILEALRIAGFEDPELLTPRLMFQLLVQFEQGKPGAIFILHDEEPRLPKKQTLEVTPKKKRGFLQKLRSSMSAATLQFTSSVTNLWYGSGLYAVC